MHVSEEEGVLNLLSSVNPGSLWVHWVLHGTTDKIQVLKQISLYIYYNLFKSIHPGPWAHFIQLIIFEKKNAYTGRLDFILK